MNDLYISILNYLNDWEMMKDEQAITKVYNICHTLYNQKILSDISTEKNLDSNAMQVIKDVIGEHGAMDHVNNLIKNPIHFNSLPVAGNIFNIIGNDGLDFWKDLASKQPKTGKNPVGPFELLLVLILKDAIKSDVGDVKIGDIDIEIKSGGGRCELRDNKKSPEVVNTYLNMDLKNVGGKKYGMELNMADNKGNIRNSFNKDITPVNLAASLFQQYTDIFGKNWKKSSAFEDFSNFIKDNFEKIAADPGNALRRIYGILSIYCYTIVNKHDYLMIFKKIRTGKNKGLTGDYVIVSKNDTFQQLYDNKHIVVESVPRCKDSRNYFPQLNCA